MHESEYIRAACDNVHPGALHEVIQQRREKEDANRRCLCRGTLFTKHTSLKSHARFVCCSPDMRYICWGPDERDVLAFASSLAEDKPKRKEPQLDPPHRASDGELQGGAPVKYVLVSDMVEVRMHDKKRCRFSIVFRQRRLNLECDSEKQREEWAQLFEWLLRFRSLVSHSRHVSHASLDLAWDDSFFSGVDGSKEFEDLFELVELLGTGTYGRVYRVVHRDSGFTLAAKMLKVSDTQRSSDVRKEMDVLRKCHHPNIVRYYGCFGPDSQNRLWLLMEWCEMGSAVDLCGRLTSRSAHTAAAVIAGVSGALASSRSVDSVTSESFSSLPPQLEDLLGLAEQHIRYICASVLRALYYLHTVKGVTHQDIKGRNILITRNAEVKLSDFGRSKEIACAVAGAAGSEVAPVQRTDSSFFNTLASTAYWMAPEVIADVAHTEKSDIWSLGITCIELAVGQAPRSQFAPVAAQEAIVKSPPPSLARCVARRLRQLGVESGDATVFSEEFYDFVDQCLQKDMQDRPDIQHLLRHPFVRHAPLKSTLGRLISRVFMDSSEDIREHRDSTREQSIREEFDVMQEDDESADTVARPLSRSHVLERRKAAKRTVPYYVNVTEPRLVQDNGLGLGKHIMYTVNTKIRESPGEAFSALLQKDASCLPPASHDACLKITEWTISLPAFGVKMTVEGTKPAGLQFSQATLDVGGDAFWDALYSTLSFPLRMAAKVIRSTRLPAELCPTVLRPEDFPPSSSRFRTTLELGTASSEGSGVSGSSMLRASLIRKRLVALATHGGNPSIQLVVRYSRPDGPRDEGSEGVLVALEVTARQILQAIDSGENLVNLTRSVGSNQVPRFKSVHRRYKDFTWLSERLSESESCWGVLIPPLPPATYVGRFSREFIAARRRGLAAFLHAIAHHRQLHAQSDVLSFLFASDAEFGQIVRRRKGLFGRLSSGSGASRSTSMSMSREGDTERAAEKAALDVRLHRPQLPSYLPVHDEETARAMDMISAMHDGVGALDVKLASVIRSLSGAAYCWNTVGFALQELRVVQQAFPEIPYVPPPPSSSASDSCRADGDDGRSIVDILVAPGHSQQRKTKKPGVWRRGLHQITRSMGLGGVEARDVSITHLPSVRPSSGDSGSRGELLPLNMALARQQRQGLSVASADHEDEDEGGDEKGNNDNGAGEDEEDEGECGVGSGLLGPRLLQRLENRSLRLARAHVSAADTMQVYLREPLDFFNLCLRSLRQLLETRLSLRREFATAFDELVRRYDAFSSMRSQRVGAYSSLLRTSLARENSAAASPPPPASSANVVVRVLLPMEFGGGHTTVAAPRSQTLDALKSQIMHRVLHRRSFAADSGEFRRERLYFTLPSNASGGPSLDMNSTLERLGADSGALHESVAICLAYRSPDGNPAASNADDSTFAAPPVLPRSPSSLSDLGAVVDGDHGKETEQERAVREAQHDVNGKLLRLRNFSSICLAEKRQFLDGRTGQLRRLLTRFVKLQIAFCQREQLLLASLVDTDLDRDLDQLEADLENDLELSAPSSLSTQAPPSGPP